MEQENIQQITIVWGFRKQTLKESTEDLIMFLNRLYTFDNRFKYWYKTGINKKDAQKNKIKIKYDEIKKMFCAKCSDNEYPEYSFDLSVWNGEAKDNFSYGMVLSIGGYKIGNNMVQFSFPYKGELYEHYRIKENWEELFNLFVDHWKPEKYKSIDNKIIEL